MMAMFLILSVVIIDVKIVRKANENNDGLSGKRQIERNY
jgi:hypothetical protein